MRDGWASETARRVAAHRLRFERFAASYGDPAADERLARNVAGDVATSASSPMAGYLAARTAFFDRSVVGALERGIAQVVVAAAGYDGRAWRYAKPGVRWFEVDHPDTQHDKRSRLRELGIDAGHVTFVPADFATAELEARLLDAGFDPGQPALMLCEGVAVYLDRLVLAAVLRDLGALAAPGSRLVISLSVDTGSPRMAVTRTLFQARVAAVGEPAKTVLTAVEAEELFADAGWRFVAAPNDRARRAGFVVAQPK